MGDWEFRCVGMGRVCMPTNVTVSLLRFTKLLL